MPSDYTKGKETVPLDLSLRPIVFVLGMYKSGKTALCQSLSTKLSMVHLKPEDVI